ncbi:two-component sensor histidine kinase [Roseinatronobacter bogoriensis subsp. barguzinensis]|nr:two-component sensor histidine kinase [Rhodobaca barguzinensis]TDY68214.1 two-component sensor histidine kinase [Rhodobaca bogoriensis DSM 18756]
MSSDTDTSIFQNRGYFGRFMNGLSAALMAQRSVRYQAAFGLWAVTIATALRFGLDGVLPPGFPFLTFFPAVMLSLIFGSIRCGIAVAVACGLIAWFWFIEPAGQFGMTHGAFLAIGFYMLITTTDVLFVTAAVWALRELDVSRLKAHELAQSRSLMFSELQHRVSNNLATIAALLRLQSSQTKDDGARRALTASQARIKSISRLQRRLHSVDIQTVDAAEYLREVLQDTLDVAKLEKPVDMRIQADPLVVPNDVAVPLGLIASELMMNSIEHGATLDRPITITISLKSIAPLKTGPVEATLEILDDGPGLPDDFDLAQADSLGLSVASQFATSLDGKLTLETGAVGGTLARLRFRVGTDSVNVNETDELDSATAPDAAPGNIPQAG